MHLQFCKIIFLPSMSCHFLSLKYAAWWPWWLLLHELYLGISMLSSLYSVRIINMLNVLIWTLVYNVLRVVVEVGRDPCQNWQTSFLVCSSLADIHCGLLVSIDWSYGRIRIFYTLQSNHLNEAAVCNDSFRFVSMRQLFGTSFRWVSMGESKLLN